MEQSILKSTKKILGVSPEDESFDLDIITHINSAFSTLHDLGIGPEMGYVIEDAEPVWSDFLESDLVLQSKVKTYVYLSVRLLFDPPTNSFVMDALHKQIEECTWRLNVNRESLAWTEPAPIIVVDGGDPVGPHFVD